MARRRALPVCCYLTFLTSIALPPAVTAAEPGAWETFSALNQVDAWRVYDEFSEVDPLAPQWAGDFPGEEYAYAPHSGDGLLWFYTDTALNAGAGKLMGDYGTDKIQGILADVLIYSPEDFAVLDCAIFTTGPAGATFYYSLDYVAENFPESGWYSVRFGLDETWFFLNQTNQYVPVTVTPQMLLNIREIGFRFFPVLGTTAESLAAIDDVKLEPLVQKAELRVSATATEFRLAFTPPKANSCLIQKALPAPASGWEDVAGETAITGTAEHVFTTPLAGGRAFFRVQTEEAYTPFVTVPAGP